MLHHVELFTRDGHFVARVLAPQLCYGGKVIWPEVLVWGDRIFARSSLPDMTPPSYVEGVAFIVRTEAEMREDGVMEQTPTFKPEQR